MPGGSPAASPNFGAPRYADSDPATFSADVNAVTDTFDAKAVINTDSRLTDQRTPLDNSVTTAKLVNASVTGAKIAAATIAESNLAPLSVGTPELIAASVTNAKLASGAVATANIQTGAVTSNEIADGTVANGDLATAVQQATLQPGDLIPSAANTRAGALLCDGSAVSRTTFAALFAAIGTTYGAGDGSTTFNVPDFRGKSPLGAGTGTGLTARTRGQTGGSESHTHTVPSLSVPQLSVPSLFVPGLSIPNLGVLVSSHTHPLSGNGAASITATPQGGNQLDVFMDVAGISFNAGYGSYAIAGGPTYGSISAAGGSWRGASLYGSTDGAATGGTTGTGTTGSSATGTGATGTGVTGTGTSGSTNGMSPFIVVNYFVKT